MTHDRKTAEVVTALFVLGFGGFISGYASTGINVVRWAGFDLVSAAIFGWCFIAASVVHSLGIWLNGRWRWSPMIRFVGLVAAFSLYLHLAIQGSRPPSTAQYMYLSTSFLFLVAAISMLRDVRAAVSGLYGPARS